jgi:hypothetical protein
MGGGRGGKKLSKNWEAREPQVKPVCPEDDRVENQRQDDVEGEDKDKTNEGDMNKNETGEQVGGRGRRGLHVANLMFLIN